jgi:hypothetical protein
MAHVIPGTALRNKLLARFPDAIRFLEEGSFKQGLAKHLQPLDIEKVPFTEHEDPTEIGDILYIGSSMRIVLSSYRESWKNTRGEGAPARYAAYPSEVGITSLAALQEGLADRTNIPRLMLDKRLKEKHEKYPGHKSVFRKLLEDMLTQY